MSLMMAKVNNKVKGVTHEQQWCDQLGGHQTSRVPSTVAHCPLQLLWESEPEGGKQICQHQHLQRAPLHNHVTAV